MFSNEILNIEIEDKEILDKKLSKRDFNCIIFEYFLDANDTKWCQNDYCIRNCHFECLNKNSIYKKNKKQLV